MSPKHSEKGNVYYGNLSFGITLLIAVVGAGICQLDNTTRPIAAKPVRTKKKITIRVIFPTNFVASLA